MEPKKRGRKRDPNSLRSRGDTSRHTSPRKAFHAPAELFAALQAYCERTGEPESAVIRAALADYLYRHPPKGDR